MRQSFRRSRYCGDTDPNCPRWRRCRTPCRRRTGRAGSTARGRDAARTTGRRGRGGGGLAGRLASPLSRMNRGASSADSMHSSTVLLAGKRVDASAAREPRARRSAAVRARAAADDPGVAPDRDARRAYQRRRIPVQGGTDSSRVLRVRAFARGLDARAPPAIPGRQLRPEDAGPHRGRRALDRRQLEHGLFSLAGRRPAEAVSGASASEGLDAAAAARRPGPALRRAVAGAVRRRPRAVCRHARGAHVPPAVRADARRAAGALQRRGDSERPGRARRGVRHRRRGGRRSSLHQPQRGAPAQGVERSRRPRRAAAVRLSHSPRRIVPVRGTGTGRVRGRATWCRATARA